jgi:hypothetical protein
MTQIRWFFVLKVPSPLSPWPWPLWGHFNQIAKTKEKTTINTDETVQANVSNTIVSISIVIFMVGCWLRLLWPSPSSRHGVAIPILLFE